MTKKITPHHSDVTSEGTGQEKGVKEQDIERLKENLDKTGKALGDLFKGVFKGVSKIVDIALEMEKKGEETRIYQKKIKGVTPEGKEFRGEAGWKISTGLLKTPIKKR